MNAARTATTVGQWEHRRTFGGMSGYQWTRHTVHNLTSGLAWDSAVVEVRGVFYVAACVVTNALSDGSHVAWLNHPGIRIWENKRGGRGRVYFRVTEALVDHISGRGRGTERDGEVEQLAVDLIDLIREEV